MQDIKSTTEKMDLLRAMWIRRYGAVRIAQYGRSRATLDATGHHHPGGLHGHRFWHQKSSCGVVKSLSDASVQKARKGPSTQLIEATSCVDRSNTTMKAKELI